MKERRNENCEDKFEAKLQAKEERLPKSIRTYIRRLKEDGKWEEAVRFRETITKQRRTRQEFAAEELHKTIAEVICEDDPLKEATGEVKIVWLLNAVGILGTESRKEEILGILDSQPEQLQPLLEQQLPGIRDRVKTFLPLAG
jgi:hypothetical protein